MGDGICLWSKCKLTLTLTRPSMQMGAVVAELMMFRKRPVTDEYEIDPTKNEGRAHAFHDVKRRKEERKCMHGGDCEECQDVSPKSQTYHIQRLHLLDRLIERTKLIVIVVCCYRTCSAV